MNHKYILMLMVILFIFSFTKSDITFANQKEDQSLYIEDIVSSEEIRVRDNENIKLYGTSIEAFEIYEKEFKRASLNFSDYQNVDIGFSPIYFKSTSVEEIKSQGENFLVNLIKNKKVIAKHVIGDRYILYLENSSMSINEILLGQGYVELSKNLSNNPIDKHLILATSNAYNNKYGIWNINFYVKVKNPPGKGQLDVLKYYQIGNFVLIMIFTILLIKKYSYFRLIIFYSCAINSALSILLMDSEIKSNSQFLVGLSFNIFILILCLILFVSIIFKNSKVSVILSKIFLFVLYIILVFSSIYYSFSHSQVTEHITARAFPSFEITSSDTSLPISNYLYTNEGLKEPFIGSDEKIYQIYFLDQIDAIYFSGTTFFGGSYGDVTPKGILKIISLIEMALSFFIQIFLFSFATSKLYERFSNKVMKPVLDNTHLSENIQIKSLSRIETYKKKRIHFKKLK